MKSRTRLLGLAMVALAVSLTGCSSSDKPADDQTQVSDPPAQAPGPGDAPGFTEYPIGETLDLPPLEVAAVYFQPVDMEPAGTGLSAAESDMHIEADISAGPNDLGYGVGDFVPNLRVDYSIEKESGEVAASGTFMPMNATDGPHYGANIALPDAGIYQVIFTIYSPEQAGHVLHIDPETGVTGRYWTTPIVAEWTFDYTPREW